jgi:hypothetical protein
VCCLLECLAVSYKPGCWYTCTLCHVTSGKRVPLRRNAPPEPYMTMTTSQLHNFTTSLHPRLITAPRLSSLEIRRRTSFPPVHLPIAMRVNDSHLKEEELEACYSLAALSGKICDENAISTPSQPSPLATEFSTKNGCASSPSSRSDEPHGESGEA